MPPPALPPPSWRVRFLAALLATQVLVVAAMSASPTFHEWIHQDAGQEDHECAVTLFLHGATDGPAAPEVLAAAGAYFLIGLANGPRVAALGCALLRGSVSERAPPAGA